MTIASEIMKLFFKKNLFHFENTQTHLENRAFEEDLMDRRSKDMDQWEANISHDYELIH
jgi:hypothetical protein